MKTIIAIICITIIAVAGISLGHDAQLITGTIGTIAALGGYAVGARQRRKTPRTPTSPPDEFHQNC